MCQNDEQSRTFSTLCKYTTTKVIQKLDPTRKVTVSYLRT